MSYCDMNKKLDKGEGHCLTAVLLFGRKRSQNGKTRQEMTGSDNIRQKAMRSVNCMY